MKTKKPEINTISKAEKEFMRLKEEKIISGEKIKALEKEIAIKDQEFNEAVVRADGTAPAIDADRKRLLDEIDVLNKSIKLLDIERRKVQAILLNLEGDKLDTEAATMRDVVKKLKEARDTNKADSISIEKQLKAADSSAHSFHEQAAAKYQLAAQIADSL